MFHSRTRARVPMSVGCLAAMAVLGCDGGGGARSLDGLATTTAALGQPSGDDPSYDERVVLYASNRARMSPAAEGWPTYPAVPPLQWNLSLNQSARAHSVDMRDTPCFQHPSCGSATDDTFARVRMYYTGAQRALGENIAAGPADGITIVHNWIFEIGATPGETGHRDNLFSPSFNLLGSGYAPGGMPRPAINNFWTQDFAGTGAALALPRMTDGIHFSNALAGGVGAITFGTTYYDVSGVAPSRVGVSVDGNCTSLALASVVGLPRGSAAKGAYEATVTLTPGCHAYYFFATSGSTDVSYPDSGALQVAVGAVPASSCPTFVATRVAATCAVGSGANGGAGGSGAGGADGGADGGIAMGSGGTAGNSNRPPLGGAAGSGPVDSGVSDERSASVDGAADVDGASAETGVTGVGAGPPSGMGCACRIESTRPSTGDAIETALIACGCGLGLCVRGRRRRRARSPSSSSSSSSSG